MSHMGKPEEEEDSLGNLLFEAAMNNEIAKVRELLQDPRLDINQTREKACSATALHAAAIWGHTQIVKLLMGHPQVAVNQRDSTGSTPFFCACTHGRVETAKEMLKDPRVDVTVQVTWGPNALSTAAYYDHIGVVKWLIASGRQLAEGADMTMEKTALVLARRRENFEIAQLLERYVENPQQTREMIRRDLGMKEVLAADIFSLLVFLSDDYFQIKKNPNKEDEPTRRFFAMASKLPMDLQMVLSNRVAGVAKEFIGTKEVEASFRILGPQATPQKSISFFQWLLSWTVNR